MSDILNRLNSNAHPECTYVGKNYTKADLIADVERLEADKERLEARVKAIINAWESLPQGDYFAKDIDQWLNEIMKPTMDELRKPLPGESDER